MVLLKGVVCLPRQSKGHPFITEAKIIGQGQVFLHSNETYIGVGKTTIKEIEIMKQRERETERDRDREKERIIERERKSSVCMVR